MLSTEAPHPSSSLSSSTVTTQPEGDILGSHGSQQHQSGVDLWRSGLVDNTPVPKFSIRDYVFNIRGRGIENHWPFCPKNLQLCLNRGAKVVLPPFQGPDSVKNSPDANPSASSNHAMSISPNEGGKLASDIEEDKENPSTSSHCCSNINSVGLTDSLPEADNLPQSSAEKPEFSVLPASHKGVINPQNQVKNSGLIEKLTDTAERRRPSEELLVPELAMASKVCPVCKTFSSSSNTTLNAHIDQCLSDEPANKLAMNSKLIKHRIKPRKTRSMTDIYATSICCTLEELDRRNGTNWASNSYFPMQEEEHMEDLCAEEKNIATPSIGINDNHDNGAVYFDSNGTKLRMFSKTDKLPSDLNGKDDQGPEKLVKKKKRHLVRRYKLLLKCPPGEQSCSLKLNHRHEVYKGSGQKLHPEEDKKEAWRQASETQEQMDTDELGMIKQWVGSKKMINRENESRRLIKAPKKLRAHSNMPLLHLRKREGSHDHHGKRNSMALSEFMDLPSSAGERLTYQNDKRTRCARPDTSCDSSFAGPRMLWHNTSASKGKDSGSFEKITSNRALISQGKRLSSLRDDHLSIGNALLPQSKKKLGKKHLNLKKRRLRRLSGSEDLAMEMLESSGKLLRDRSKELKTQRQVFSDSEDGGMVLRNSEDSGSHEEKNSNSFRVDSVLDDSSNGLDADIRDQSDCYLSTNLSSGKAFMTFGEALDSGSDPDASDHYIKAYEEYSQAEPEFQENFCDEELGNGSDASDTQMGSYFLDVDVITIPGPPGSFLPSPGHTGSEDLHGTSSLTTCRIHSEYELVDMDSSDSPVSAASFASNSIAGRSSLEQSSGAQCGISQDRMEPVVENSSNPFEQATGPDGNRKLDESRDDLIFPLSSDSAYQNALPCCCSRKKVVLQNGSLDYRHPGLPERQAMTSIPEISRETNNELYHSDLRTETLPENKSILAVKKVAEIERTAFIPHSSEAIFTTYADCESPNPCTPGSVLRLMGKNLTVVTKEENVSPQTRLVEKSMAVDHASLRSNINCHASLQSNINLNGIKQNAHQSSCHDISQDSSVHTTLQTDLPVCCMDFGSMDGSRMHARYQVPKLSAPLMDGRSVDIKASDEADLDAVRASVRITAPRLSGCDANPFHRHPTPGFPIYMAETASNQENNTINGDPISGNAWLPHPSSLASTGYKRPSLSFSITKNFAR